MFNEKLSETLANAINFIDSIESEYKHYSDEVTRCNKLQQDYLHELELSELSDEEITELANDFKLLRKERRKYKDMVQLLEPLLELVEKDCTEFFKRHAKQTLGAVRKVEKYHETRFYVPRIRK